MVSSSTPDRIPNLLSSKSSDTISLSPNTHTGNIHLESPKDHIPHISICSPKSAANNNKPKWSPLFTTIKTVKQNIVDKMESAQHPQRLPSPPIINEEDAVAQNARRLHTAKRNVYTALVYTFILNTALTICLGPIFDKFVFQLGGSNVYVGLVESINGIVLIAVIAPVAWLVDQRGPGRRAGLIWQSCVVGTLAVGLFGYAIFCDNLPFLYTSLASNALYYELLSSSMGALFTDSAQALGGSAGLQKWTVTQSIVQGVASCFGPLLTLWLQIGGGIRLNDENAFAKITGETSSSSSSQTSSSTSTTSPVPVSEADRNVWSLGFMHLILISGVTLYLPLLVSTFCFQDMEDEVVIGGREGGNSGISGESRERNSGGRGNGGTRRRSVDTTRSGVGNNDLAVPLLDGRSGDPLTATTSTQIPGASPPHDLPPSPVVQHIGIRIGTNNSADEIVDEISSDVSDISSRTGGTEVPVSLRVRLQPWIPYIITAADVMTCLGLGMSSKFLILFLIQDFGLTGVQTSIFQLTCALSTIVFITGLQFLNQKGFGTRCQISIGCMIGSICCYLALGSSGKPVPEIYPSSSPPSRSTSTSSDSHSHSLSQKGGRSGSRSDETFSEEEFGGEFSNDFWRVCIFIVMANLAFAKGPLDKSLVLENTSPKERGRWNAVQSFNLTLCGAMGLIGGWLADKWGYRSIFSFTGYLWILATLVYSPLLWIVEEERKGKGGGKAGNNKAEGSSGQGNG